MLKIIQGKYFQMKEIAYICC